MAAYVTFGTTDPARSKAFYDATFATIGWAQFVEYPDWRAYCKGGTDKSLALWVGKPHDGAAATHGNGTMLGLMVDTRAEVDAFHAAAMANGGRDEGPPGPREAYGPDWYAAYMRDPTGNKIAIVCVG